jgi:hypothetical protein
MRWTRKGIVDKTDYTIYYSCHKEKNTSILGAGLRVIKRTKHHILDFKVKSRRLCRWGIRRRLFNDSIICACAPTEDMKNLTGLTNIVHEWTLNY